ncbi:MAG: SGNH/GDSL hydrolase family protein, partial [Anaerolineae bacterium]|nr:SGNH/GDSL hydrolase family protein [Anaerolineae bacterium]
YLQAKQIAEGYVTPDQFEQNYRDLLTRLQLAHVLPWVGLQPSEYNRTLVDVLQQFNARAAIAARAHNIPTLDLMQPLTPSTLTERPPFTMDDINLIGRRVKAHWDDYETARQRRGFTYTFDGSHPTPQGAEKIAALVADFLPS